MEDVYLSHRMGVLHKQEGGDGLLPVTGIIQILGSMWKWVVQIICAGLIVAIWIPAFYASGDSQLVENSIIGDSLEAQAEEEAFDMPYANRRAMEISPPRAAMPPPSYGSYGETYDDGEDDGDDGNTETLPGEIDALESDRSFAWEENDVLRERLRRIEDSLYFTSQAGSGHLLSGANEWLTFLTGSISFITFLFQFRDWRRKKTEA